MAKSKKYALGTLNPIRSRNPVFNSNHKKFISHVRATVASSANNSLVGTGPYKAVCLRVESPGQSTRDPADWDNSLFEEAAEQSSLLKIKARIPELDVMLPDPAEYGALS